MDQLHQSSSVHLLAVFHLLLFSILIGVANLNTGFPVGQIYMIYLIVNSISTD